MFEKTKRDLKVALEYAEKLVETEKHDPKNMKPNTVPKEIGVYLFRSKKTDAIVYAGQALGKQGLRQRILHQHLRPSYTKRSVFRNQIAEKYGLNPKQEVPFIKDNFIFSFLPFERKDEDIVRLVEKILIKKYSPKYNRNR